MVALQILVLSVQVRILVSQPNQAALADVMSARAASLSYVFPSRYSNSSANSKRLASKRPLSVSLTSGITGRHMNAIVI